VLLIITLEWWCKV